MESLASGGCGGMWRLVLLLCFLEGFGVQGAEWEIYVVTSDVKHAGSDSGIYITLLGVVGASQEIELDNVRQNDFERGETDRFIISTPDIGEVCFVVIRSNGLYAAPGWHLQQIWIFPQGSNQGKTFWCDRWLTPEGVLDRGIYPNRRCLINE